MRYIKPPDFKSVKELQEKYQRIENEIATLLTSDASARTSGDLNKKLQQAVDTATQYLTKANGAFAKDELYTAFSEGTSVVKKKPIKTQKEIASILQKQGYAYAANGLSKDVYIELQSATKSAGNGLKERINKIIDGLREIGEDSVYNVQQEILKDLQKNGLMFVEYANGAKQPLHAYAAMAARSARIETKNIGALGRALQSGTDLVEMTRMPQCCALCGAYQGKVYSISGNDKRFPALFKTVLRNGYALPHPNCRHEFIPFYEDMEDPTDVQKAIKDSKIKYDKDGKLADVRWQKDIEAYAQWQAGNRQLNREALEFKRMQEHYARIGQEPPYKTLGAFRTARRRETLSPAFKAWRNKKLDENTLNRWKSIKNFRNCPKSLENLQKIKYNKHAQWDLLKRERKTIEDINGKNWSEDFRNKALDTYYYFRDKNVEFTDHGVARLLQRGIPFEKVLEIDGKSFNYKQKDLKYVKFYNALAIIYTKDKKEIVSIVERKTIKEAWDEIKN